MISMTGGIRRLIIPVVIVVLWSVLVMNAGPHTLAPEPSKIIESLYNLTITGTLPLSLLVSFGRILLGFLISLIVALLVGIPMATSKKIERNLDPIINSVRHIAPIAFVPLAILWFGSGTPAAVFVIAFASFFPMVLNVITGVRSVDHVLLRAGKSMGLNRKAMTVHIVIPASLPAMLNGARISMGVAWMSVIAAELAVSAKSGSASSGGIGQLMFTYYAYSVHTNNLVACMIGIGLVALGVDAVFRWFQSQFAGWAMRNP